MADAPVPEVEQMERRGVTGVPLPQLSPAQQGSTAAPPNCRANVLGGRGTYLSTVAGVILITLLPSILSAVQPQSLPAEIGLAMLAGSIRQIVLGVVIAATLLLYGRERLSREQVTNA